MILLDTIVTLPTADTLQIISDVSQQVVERQSASGNAFGTFIDYAYKISMLCIAIANFVYIWNLNQRKDTKEQDKEQEERTKQKRAQRIGYLKTLVYEENLPNLYIFFVELETELSKLKDQQANIGEIEKNLQTIFKNLRSKFIIVLSAAVPELGSQVQNIADTMHDQLVSNMSDEGVNLWVERYYNDMIKKVYEEGKVNIVSTLFNYDGH